MYNAQDTNIAVLVLSLVRQWLVLLNNPGFLSSPQFSIYCIRYCEFYEKSRDMLIVIVNPLILHFECAQES